MDFYPQIFDETGERKGLRKIQAAFKFLRFGSGN
jgi:hypothetical protein